MAVPQAPDLFVVCKNCGSEVSSFVTECPYCGARLRKRAPKLEAADLSDAARPRRVRAPRLPRLHPGEIPGIRADPTHRPVVSIALAIAVAVGAIAEAVFDLSEVAVFGSPDGEWWRVATAPFFCEDLLYAAVCVLAIALFGGLLERAHGALAPLSLFVLGGIGGTAVAAAVETIPFAAGANGAALAMTAAWVMGPLRDLRNGNEPEGDVIGAGVFAAVLLLMPLAVEEASATAGAVGLLVGIVVGALLARRR
jgi:membrane associated rhomboid family serine protease